MKPSDPDSLADGPADRLVDRAADRAAGDLADDLVDYFIACAVADGRIRALWAEADDASRLRRPYRDLELHLAADEPVFAALVAGIEPLVTRRFLLERCEVSDTARCARQFDMLLRDPERGGPALPLRLVVERTALLAKRPRAHVVSLCDKTEHLLHVMEFTQ